MNFQMIAHVWWGSKQFSTKETEEFWRAENDLISNFNIILGCFCGKFDVVLQMLDEHHLLTELQITKTAGENTVRDWLVECDNLFKDVWADHNLLRVLTEGIHDVQGDNGVNVDSSESWKILISILDKSIMWVRERPIIPNWSSRFNVCNFLTLIEY